MLLSLDLLSLWRAQVKETTSAVVSLVSMAGIQQNCFRSARSASWMIVSPFFQVSTFLASFERLINLNLYHDFTRIFLCNTFLHLLGVAAIQEAMDFPSIAILCKSCNRFLLHPSNTSGIVGSGVDLNTATPTKGRFWMILAEQIAVMKMTNGTKDRK